MKILLDYFMPVTSITPTPAASTAFLKQVCILVLPKMGVTPGEVTMCTSYSAVQALTDNTEAEQLFNAGMSRVYVLPCDDLDVAAALAAEGSDFYSLLISSDFDDDDIAPTQAQGTVTVTSYADLLTTTPDTLTIEGTVFTAQSGAATLGTATFRAATSNEATATSLAAQINGHATAGALVEATVVGAVVTIKAKSAGSAGNDIGLSYADVGTASIGITLAGLSGGNLAGGDGLFVGSWKGVIGISTTDDTDAATYAATENYVGFHTNSANKAKNMFYAFGKLLSNALNWTNQQYITMPVADDVDELGEANALFDDKVSFVLNDDEFGKRLALFATGGKAIVAPYIKRNLEVDMQSAALTYISGNQPAYTNTQAALLEDELQKVVNSYIARGWIAAGKVEVKLEASNFNASAYINIAEPKAMWRVPAEIRQTL